MKSKNPDHAAVMTAVLEAFDKGTRGGDLIAVFVDKAHEVRSAAGRPDLRTEIITGILLPASLGESRDDLEKALYGFNV